MKNNILASPEEVSNYLSLLDNVIIFTHERPDGDAIGSLFALQKALCAEGKEVDVYFSENLPARYSHLANENTYISKRRENHQYSACIALDCGNFERLESFEKGSPLNLPILNIDHHPDNTLFGTKNFINPEACATSEIILDILSSEKKWTITSDVANCLLLGILLDSGGLRFDNTNATVLRKVARLIELGANYASIIKSVFFTEPLGAMTLKSDLILNHMKIICNGRFAYTYLSEELLRKHKVEYKDTEGIIDYIRTVNNLIIAAVISKNKNGFRISLRSNSVDYPVNIIAKELSGGGHALAAGCMVETDKFEEAERILLDKVSSVLRSL